jgi:hypothetical protein
MKMVDRVEMLLVERGGNWPLYRRTKPLHCCCHSTSRVIILRPTSLSLSEVPWCSIKVLDEM